MNETFYLATHILLTVISVQHMVKDHRDKGRKPADDANSD